MKFIVAFVAVACFAQSGLSVWAPHHGPYSLGGYHGPLASPIITPSGYLADTPEVASAKAAHLSELAKASSHVTAEPNSGYRGAGLSDAGYYSDGNTGGYRGPLAKLVVTSSGFLADTPEVAAAKAAHMSLLGGASHGAYAPAVPVVPYATPYVAPYDGHNSALRPRAYDDGNYKGEGYYSSHHDATSQYDDGSYKPHLYEHRHY